jgi:hypothetical protein
MALSFGHAIAPVPGIDKFAPDGRLANLLKLLVVLVCLGAILQRVLPLTY